MHTKNSLDIIAKPYTKWPMQSVDIPKSNFLLESINKLTLFGLFTSEKLLGKGILQTISAQKKIN